MEIETPEENISKKSLKIWIKASTVGSISEIQIQTPNIFCHHLQEDPLKGWEFCLPKLSRVFFIDLFPKTND